MFDQWIVFGTLLGALILFINGRLRYDLVALLALLAVTITGVVPPIEAFLGFGHPAVITVAGVLVVSRGLMNAGLVDIISKWVMRVGDNTTMQVLVLTAVVAVSSAFMNNVGALALMMPVAIRMARKNGHSASKLLMPLAFGSLLGGMTTLIGTPPNIIIAQYRAEVSGTPFQMFDFSPVGIGALVAGGIFLALVGWRLIPQREGKSSRNDLFQIEDYTTEVRVPETSPLVGKMINQIRSEGEIEMVVIAILREDRRIPFPPPHEVIVAEDVLLIETEPEQLEELLDIYRLKLEGSGSTEHLGSKDIDIVEAIVTPNSPILNQSPLSLNLRRRFGVNLIAVARQGARVRARLSHIRFRAGDILLLQMRAGSATDVLNQLGCLPLAEREIKLGKTRQLLIPVTIFAAALLLAATGVLPIAITMVSAALAMLILGVLDLQEAYESIDWPIIILLGAMIPVGTALETSGGAQAIADWLLAVGQQLPPVVTLTVILVGTMFLSDLINNAAAAVLMAPIAIGVAFGLGASADPFLLAVGIGASCAFLTPIGHQSNTLVMGPGGYRFGDYWRMGLPLEIIIVVVTIPLLMIFWPL